MGAIQNYSYNDFLSAIQSQAGKQSVQQISQNTDKLKSIFDIAARTDVGDKNELLETDHKGFVDLVNGALTALGNMFEKGKDALKQFEFIPGNSKTKQNGAITPDTMKEYENGELVKTVIGFDDDGNGRIEGNEVETELVAGNSRTKQNGALTPDRMNEYEDGKVKRTVIGFDDDDSGRIEGKEVETELIAGNWKTKQNGALTPDRMNEYEDGKVKKSIEGFDEDGNGRIEGREIWE